MALSLASAAGWRSAARPAWPWAQTPLRSLLVSGSTLLPCSCRRRTVTSSTAQATAEPPALHAFEAEVETDAHMHMLASPLRRCVVSQAMLPSALMMRLEPVDLPASAASDKSDSQQAVEAPSPGDGGSSAAVKAKAEALGPDVEIAPAEAIRQRILLPSKLPSTQRTLGRHGRGVWVSLDHELARLATVRGVNRRHVGCAPPPENLPSLISDELCRQLLDTARSLHGAKAGRTKQNWLVRRVKGRAWQELLGVTSQKHDALAADTPDDAVWQARQQVSAVLVFPGEEAAPSPLPDGPSGSAPPSEGNSTPQADQSPSSDLPPALRHMSTPPVYDMAKLLSAAAVQTLHEALRAVSINLQQTKPAKVSKTQAQRTDAAAEGSADASAQSSKPRVIALQRSATTVPFAIALHRLALWQGP